MQNINAQEEALVDAPPAEPTPAQRQLEEIKKAAQFLGRFAQSEFEFRYIYDPPDMKDRTLKPNRDWGTLKDHAKKLARLNKGHAGIFFGVNANDGQGFKTANIVSTCCVFVDLDGAPLANLDRLPIRPHAIIGTSPGKWHAYWFVIGLPLDQFKLLQKRLAALIEADPSVCDLARIMRLPGFYHQKDPDNPFLVRVAEMTEEPDIAFADFEAALAAAEQERGIGKKSAAGKAVWETPQNDNGAKPDDLAQAESALRHLIGKNALNLSIYPEWVSMGMALHHSHGEEGFVLFHELSAEAGGYDGEDACREKWASFSTPPDRPITMATYFAKARAEGWRPAKKKGKPGRPPSEDKPDAASITLELVRAAGDEFWVDQNGTVCVSIEQKRPDGTTYQEHMPVNGRDYCDLIADRFHNHFVQTRTLSAEQQKRAVALLEGKRKTLDQHRLYNRFGAHDGAIYLDLGRKDWKCVRIDEHGWEIVGESQARFTRGSRAELPIPERGGSMNLFERHFNVSPNDRIKVVGFLISCFNPAGAYPILGVTGEQGSGKSNLGDNVLQISDPPSQPKNARFSLCKDEHALVIHAEKVAVVYFDNLSGLSPEMADALCRLATAGSFTTRVLYSNDSERQFALSRPIVLTSIGTPSPRGDLLSRCLQVEALTIPKEKRRTERTLRADFARDHPQMLGFILDCVSMALRNMSEVQAAAEAGEISPPRLADVALFVEGAADLLGIKRGAFCEMLQAEQERLQADSALDDKLGGALYRYLSTMLVTELTLSARQLLDKLRGDDHRADLPAPNQVTKTLTRIAPGLRELGIEIEIGEDKSRKVSMITIKTTDAFEWLPVVKEKSIC